MPTSFLSARWCKSLLEVPACFWQNQSYLSSSDKYILQIWVDKYHMVKSSLESGCSLFPTRKTRCSGLDGARPGMVEGLASGWLALQDLSEASGKLTLLLKFMILICYHLLPLIVALCEHLNRRKRHLLSLQLGASSGAARRQRTGLGGGLH